jgi:fructose-1-phosphate kinase PfkB-like protein
MARRRGRRQIVVQQRKSPGLLGTIARTAVVAGTAKATINTMDNIAAKRQQAQMADQAAFQNQAELEQMKAQLAAMQTQQVQAAAASTPPASEPDILEKLQQLAQLKQAGMLTDAEFEAAKAKLLA